MSEAIMATLNELSLDVIIEFAKQNIVPVLMALMAAIYAYHFVMKQQEKPFLDAEKYIPLPLTKKKYINHNTVLIAFDLPKPKMKLGLPTGKHISFQANDEDGKAVYRSYTPITDDSDLGRVEFVIKLYPTGKMSQIISKLEVGQSILMRGPKGMFNYKPNMKRAFGMIAGGSGITPMYQVLKAILSNPKDKSQVSLIFANVNEEDILLREELDALAAEHRNYFKVYYVLNNPPEGWKGGAGFVTQDMIKANLPSPADDVMVLSCGPKPMTDAMKKNMDELGYSASMQFQF